MDIKPGNNILAPYTHRDPRALESSYRLFIESTFKRGGKA